MIFRNKYTYQDIEKAIKQYRTVVPTYWHCQLTKLLTN